MKHKKRINPYRSEAFAAIHETMGGMYDAGVIDKKTMREFDEACLESVDDIKPARRSLSARLESSNQRK